MSVRGLQPPGRLKYYKPARLGYLYGGTWEEGKGMSILDVMWYCGSSNVGIVRVLDQYEGIKYYIGSPPGAEWGNDEEADKQWIADWGSSFPLEVGDKLFGIDPVANGDAVPIPKNREQAEAMVKVGMHMLESYK